METKPDTAALAAMYEDREAHMIAAHRDLQKKIDTMRAERAVAMQQARVDGLMRSILACVQELDSERTDTRDCANMFADLAAAFRDKNWWDDQTADKPTRIAIAKWRNHFGAEDRDV